MRNVIRKAKEATAKNLRAFSKQWAKDENLPDELIPLVSQLDRDRGLAVQNAFISLMATSHQLRHRTLFPEWSNQGEVCGEIDIGKRATAGTSIADACTLADRIDGFIREFSAAYNFTETARYVCVGKDHALVMDGTIKYVGKEDD